MDLNRRSILRISGLLLILTGCFISLPMLVAVHFQEYDCAIAFFYVLAGCIAAGTFFRVFIPRSPEPLRKRDGLIIVTLTWLIMSFVGALPFTIQGCIPNYIDAFFETCSGFSTTGSSILTNVEAMPLSMLFWRSFTHWIGGMGIIVLAAAIFPILGIGGQMIASNESPGPVFEKTTSKIRDMARNLYVTYIIFTVLETLLLMIGGLSLYDALVQTFGTVGTGGFSNYADSIAHFGSAYVEWIIIIFMVLSGANFNLYYIAVKNGPGIFRRNTEFRLYIYIIVIFSVLIALYLRLGGTVGNFGTALRDAVFQVSSIITTTGFASTNYGTWPTFCVMMLFLLFFVGGCSSSTGGGIKVSRVLVMLKLVKRNLAMSLHPNVMYSIKVDGRIVSRDIIQEIASFLFMYAVTFLFAALLISVDGFDMTTNITAAATCIGNIGPGFGEVGPAGNFAAFSPFSKIVLSLLMLAGRLELFTFFMLVSPKFWNPYR
ncbi:MAG: TrkH family potassium uptake protein [Anaerovoracaceae bacterium]|nr:TrkH family potassium uptake protein [Anaerovoracaceae bacterium]